MHDSSIMTSAQEKRLGISSGVIRVRAKGRAVENPDVIAVLGHSEILVSL